MPDLFTHLAVARAPAVLLRSPAVRTFLIAGTFLPDIAAKGLYWGTWSHTHTTHPTHSIMGLAVLCFLAALFIEERLRGAAFAALYGGALLHVGVDLFKHNLGTGAAYLFYPFSTRGVEFGWIDAENVLLLLPFDVALLAALWGVERRRKRVHE